VKAVVISKIADDYQSIANTVRPGQEIEDQTGYIDNLGMPEAARVAKDARLAQARADREATEREQEAEAFKAAARSQPQIRQAEVAAKAQHPQEPGRRRRRLDGADAQAAAGSGRERERLGRRAKLETDSGA
jgi:uncharacterized membrane protein YqiK